jgi:hypothetical protein
MAFYDAEAREVRAYLQQRDIYSEPTTPACQFTNTVIRTLHVLAAQELRKAGITPPKKVAT